MSSFNWLACGDGWLVHATTYYILSHLLLTFMFVFISYYSRNDAEDAVKYISGTILDDRPIRVDFDWGFQEGRQWGRGRSGGQVSCCAYIYCLISTL